LEHSYDGAVAEPDPGALAYDGLDLRGLTRRWKDERDGT
jgi:hypothetical protein